MTRVFIPLLLLVASVGLFVLYINPTYQQITALQAQEAQYSDALSKVHQLQGLLQELLSKSNAFAPADVAKLQQVLPDNVDNIRLIVDINNIASQYHLSLSNLKFDETTNTTNANNPAAVGSSGGPVGSVDLGFSVTTDYNTFIAFLQNLEQSERIIDITGISFQTQNGAITTYNITFRTYWLY